MRIIIAMPTTNFVVVKLANSELASIPSRLFVSYYLLIQIYLPMFILVRIKLEAVVRVGGINKENWKLPVGRRGRKRKEKEKKKQNEKKKENGTRGKERKSEGEEERILRELQKKSEGGEEIGDGYAFGIKG